MTRLNYVTHGQPDRPAVLLLHGFMSCNDQWLENTEALASKHYVVTVELWGHGDSPTPAETDYYTLETYYAQFEAIRAELDIARWAVIGQSYGAGVVINYAIAHPERCSAVVVTNSRSAFGTLLETQKRRAAATSSPTDLRKLPFHPVHARRFPEHVKRALVDKADAMSPEAVRLTGRLAAQLNCRDRLQELNVPLLITNGRFEKSFQDDIATLQDAHPDLNVVDLDGGHSVNIEAAAGFNRVVLDFLKSQ